MKTDRLTRHASGAGDGEQYERESRGREYDTCSNVVVCDAVQDDGSFVVVLNEFDDQCLSGRNNRG